MSFSCTLLLQFKPLNDIIFPTLSNISLICLISAPLFSHAESQKNVCHLEYSVMSHYILDNGFPVCELLPLLCIWCQSELNKPVIFAIGSTLTV